MEELFEDNTYFIVMDPEAETWNIFDEDNYVHIPDSDWIVLKITGEENLEQIVKFIWKMFPCYEQVKPKI